MESVNKDIYYLWLALRLGPKNAHSLDLLTGFESVDELYECTDYSAFCLSDSLTERLLNKDLTDAIQTVEKCRKAGAGILTYRSDLYPQRMKTLRTVPPVLYFIGDLIDLNSEVCVSGDS